MASIDGSDDQAIVAIRSLAGYHEGEWKGRARSFTITPDAAAGVVKRKVSQDYTIAVKLAASDSSMADRKISLSETVSWDDEVSHRSIPLFGFESGGDVDVDDVDGSYSSDLTNPKDFPSVLTGLKNSNEGLQFVVEHCLAAGEDRRCRCFAIYGKDDALLRVVISEEERVKNENGSSSRNNNKNNDAFTFQDLLEMQEDVDRLVDKIAASMGQDTTPDKIPSEDGNGRDFDDDEDDDDYKNGRGEKEDMLTATSRLEQLGNSMAASAEKDVQELKPFDMSLLEVTNGIWLGDMIIREMPNVLGSPNEGGTGKGFGKTSSVMVSPDSSRTLGTWEMGVQKVALRWLWDFEEEIRQVVDLGKSLGVSLDVGLRKSLVGTVCVNEGFSRRIPKDERMVYVDWGSDLVGFLLGPYSVQVPRYVNFDPSATSSRAAAVAKPFYTEFGVFQSAPTIVSANSDGVIDVAEKPRLPELCCSKIARLYNYEGKLKQGCTSVYTFKRFEMEGGEEDDEDDL